MAKSGAKNGGAAGDCADPWPQGRSVKRINLALQGGGAHGALTWGVLDRLLEDDGIAIEGVTGASAGAVNGAVMAYGLSVGGREGARDLLRAVWRRVSEIAALTMMQPSPLDRMTGLGGMDYAPGYWMLDTLSRVFSPYQFNFFDINPLRDTIHEHVDFEKLRHCKTVRLYVSATNVRRGRIKIFELEEMSLDAVMASACLPYLHKAVEIDGEAYWDGGFMGNPAIFPLIYGAETRDVLLVQINPINIEKTPTSAQEIIDRLNTITFNAGLMREMRAISFVTKLIDKGFDDGGRLKRLNMHVVDAEDVMQNLGFSSKLNADWDFLCHLHDVGYARTDAWLAAHRQDLGKRSTADIDAMYL
ncbi:MAG TPA: patatin-like phospholipase family protein [Kiloniellaceae bacterium]|nr:patatin-like phospholipase family protein [Kiloniellaceae bacterium]